MREAVKRLSTRLFEMAMTVRADVGLDRNALVFRPVSVLPRMSPTESINETRPEDALLSVTVESCEFTEPTRVPSTVSCELRRSVKSCPTQTWPGTTVADAPLVRSTAAASMEGTRIRPASASASCDRTRVEGNFGVNCIMRMSVSP
ncbi:hypothetical protein [Stenotrophomonas maltophilia]